MDVHDVAVVAVLLRVTRVANIPAVCLDDVGVLRRECVRMRHRKPVAVIAKRL